MKRVFTLLPLVAVFATQFAYAATDAERLAQVEQELAMLQEQSAYDTLSDRMSINGFFTGKVGQSNNDAGYNGYDSDIDFAKGSKVGIQGTFLLGEQTKIVTQLVARGEDNWKTEMEWAFLSHDFENGFTGRIGRLRLPLFMYSDYLDVGYAQPWATPPSEVYDAVPVSAYNGIDTIYDVELGNTNLSLQASYGQADNHSDALNADFNYDDIMGLSALLSYENWAFRTTYFQSKLSSDGKIQIKNLPSLYQPFPDEFKNTKATFSGLGVSYDNGQLLAVSEYTLTKVEGRYSDTKSGYVTVGYRLSLFTPYVSYAFLETTDNNDRKIVDKSTAVASALFNWKRKAYSVGTRYDLSSNLSLKADVTYANSFSDTNGGLTANTTKLDDTVVYTVSFDAVF